VPAPVVQELSRYYRKGDEFERLYNMSQGKIQLANDRFQELQKKYFAVCRELAVVAEGANEKNEESASESNA